MKLRPTRMGVVRVMAEKIAVVVVVRALALGGWWWGGERVV